MSIQTTSFRRPAASFLIALAPMAAVVMASLTAVFPAAATERVHETRDGVKALAVDFRDLRLSDPKDVRVLIGRLQVASDLVCRAEAPTSPMTLSARRTYRTCTRTVLDRAVRAVGDPAVTALHADELSDQAQLR